MDQHIDYKKDILIKKEFVSNQSSSGKVAGEHELSMKTKPGLRGDSEKVPSLVIAKKTVAVPEQPRNDSDLPLNHSIFIPNTDTSPPVPVSQKWIPPFKTRGHCGDVTCVPCSTPNCLKCYSCLHKERRSETVLCFYVHNLISIQAKMRDETLP